MTLARLKTYFGARELGRMANPEEFFDFDGSGRNTPVGSSGSAMSVPNTTVYYAEGHRGNDFLFLHLVEPFTSTEQYVDSTLQLLQRFDVNRYCLLGAVHNFVPHTRPLVVTGSAAEERSKKVLAAAGVEVTDYREPATIVPLISRCASQLGIEAISLIVHLPLYVPLEHDHAGYLRLMQALRPMYAVPLEETDVEKAERQYRETSMAVEGNPLLEALVKHLEGNYEPRLQGGQEEVPLTPKLEMFLQEMERNFEGNT